MARGSTFLSPLTFLGSQRALARYLGRPVAQFLAVEAAGGILLLIAAAAALIWANVSAESYNGFWETEVLLGFGDIVVEEGHLDLRTFVNDALMTLFFFVVGLEIKRELVTGDLRDRRVAALPAIAALGGMVVPAAIYLGFNLGSDSVDGWGIPMATDIAFAIGVVALLGSRVPSPLKVFLLTLAIVDDIGAILVIAIFYTSDLDFLWLAVAVATLGSMFLMRRLRVWYIPAYWLVGIVAWLAFLESGVHATIAGVVIGLITPARPLMSDLQAEEVVNTLERKGDIRAEDVRAASFYIQESVPVAERLENALHPWTSYLVIPIFALANAGILITGRTVDEALSSPITLGVVLGLLVGKTIGVGGFALGAVKLRLADLPPRVGSLHMTGIAIIAGIGFTVSLFITQLAFETVALQEEAKMGILFASMVAALVGGTLLFLAGNEGPDEVELEEVEGSPLTQRATPTSPDVGEPASAGWTSS